MLIDRVIIRTCFDAFSCAFQKRTEAKDHTLTSKTTQKKMRETAWFLHHLQVLGFLSFLASKKKRDAANTWRTKRWSTSRLFKSFRGALKLSLFFPSGMLQIQVHHIFVTSAAVHFIFISSLQDLNKTLDREMQSIPQNDAKTKVRRTPWILKKDTREDLIWFFLCVASSSSSFAETSLDRLCSFFNSWRRFCNACHGQTMVKPWWNHPVSHGVFGACLDAWTSASVIEEILTKKTWAPTFFGVYGGFQK